MQAFKELQKRLEGVGYFAWEVLADGNCGAFSLQSLRLGQPLSQQLQADQLEIRRELAEAWRTAAVMPAWRAIFQQLVDTFDHAVKTEPTAPMLKPSINNVVGNDLVDLTESTPPSTPPKKVISLDVDEGTPERAVKQVGPARRAWRDRDRPRDPISQQAWQEAEKLLDQQAKEGALVLDIEDSGPPPQEQKRRRACKKRQLTAEEVAVNTVKQYLAEVQVTWPLSQRMHSRRASWQYVAVFVSAGILWTSLDFFGMYLGYSGIIRVF